MNKYSDLSSRYPISHNFPHSSFTPKLQKSTLSLKDITIHRYRSESPNITFYLSPTPTSLNGISLLSHDHNKKFEDIPEFPSPQKPLSIKLPEISTRHSDFSSLLDKIEKVVSPKPKNFHTLLREGEPVKITQPSSEYRFFKINCKGKRCPLQVKIKIYEGKLTSYVSFSETHPNQMNYDRTFNYTYFEINEKTFSFKSESVFLGIKSHVYCVFKITISFGTVISISDIKKARQNTIRDEGIFEKDDIECREKERNFIKKNIEMNGRALSKSPDLKEKIEEWEKKKVIIKERRSELIRRKKQKVIEKMNRKEKQFEENLRVMNQAEQEGIRRVRILFWSGLLIGIKVAGRLRGIVERRRMTG